MPTVADAIEKLAYEIAKDATRVTTAYDDGIAFCMFLQIASLMAYDGERLIRLLEQAGILMPREFAQPYIDLLTKMLEVIDGNMVIN